MTFYLPEIMITFEVQFFLSEESHLERPFYFREFVPSPFCEGAASGWSTWACSEPNRKLGFSWFVAAINSA
jgi:hypothetical protein